MAKGSKIVPVRVPNDLLPLMEKAIKRRNNNTQEEPWNTSDFIRHCIRAKLKHSERAKLSARNKAARKKVGFECDA